MRRHAQAQAFWDAPRTARAPTTPQPALQGHGRWRHTAPQRRGAQRRARAQRRALREPTFCKAKLKVLKSERTCHISFGPVPFAPAPAGATTTAAGGGDAQRAAQSLGISSREMPRRSSARGGRGSGRGRYGGSGGADGGDDDMTVAACLARCGVADASELAECDGLDAEWRRVKRVYFKKVLHCPGGARGASWAHRTQLTQACSLIHSRMCERRSSRSTRTRAEMWQNFARLRRRSRSCVSSTRQRL